MDLDSKITSLTQVAETALVVARNGGADQAEVALSADDGLSVTVRLGELESVEHHRDRGLAMTVYRGGRKGSASSADLSANGIQSVVERALSIATFTEIDPHAGLAPAARMGVNPPNLELAYPWALTVDEAETVAQAAEASARGFDSRISNSDGATVASTSAMKV
ncbi:MAG: DNA gyrase modulator, partial [Gammaproteobacteria bacterium]